MASIGRGLILVLVAAAMGACSNGDTSSGLPIYTGGASAGSSPGSSATLSPAPAKSTSRPEVAGSPTRTTLVRGRQPLLSAEQKPLAEAWFAYWEYVASAVTDPGSSSAASGVGKVATGQSANDLIIQINGLVAKKDHVVGTTTVNISSVVVNGSQGTICSQLRDLSYEVASSGAVVEAPQLRTPTFKAVLTRDGPIWRLSTVTRPASC